MNKYILAKALVLSLALLIFLAPAEWDIIAGDKDGLKSGSAGGPRLIFATESVDFGRLLAGQLATYSFDFVNAGDAPLKIEDDARAKGKIRLRTIKGC